MTGAPAGLAMRPADAGAEPAASLLAAFVAEIGASYGRDFVARSPSATAADFTPPGGRFVLGELEGRAVCCGGVKRLEPRVAEIKRMYVVPEARGRGLARALLVALEDAARALGYAAVRLDTGRHQPHARALYESAGYAPVADYNGNPFASFWGAKAL